MAPTFFLTPGAVKPDEVLDLSKSDISKMYAKSASKLSEESFDCISEDLLDFLGNLRDRAKAYGWDENILSVPTDLDKENENRRYFLDHYGEFTIEHLTRWEKRNLAKKERIAQNSVALYQCIKESLSREGRNKVNPNRERYEIEIDGRTYTSGLILLKVVMMKSHLENGAATRTIRREMSKLDEYIITVNQDIEKFSDYVKRNIKDLAARGEVITDLEYNIVKALKKVTVKRFNNFIDKLEDEQDASKSMEDRLNAQEILDKAEAKYKTLKADGDWTPDRDEDLYLALEAKIKKALEKNGRGRGKWKKGDKPPKRKVRVDHSRKPRDISKPITINGKQWWWCCPENGGKCGGVLRRHKPSECQGLGGVENPFKKQRRNDEKNEGKPELKIQEALAQSTLINDIQKDIADEAMDDEIIDEFMQNSLSNDE